MKNILILGGSGMLGSSLTPYLKNQGLKVFCVSRELKHKSDLIIDYMDEELFTTILNKIKPSIIINLAALTDVDKCQLYPHEAYLANVMVVERASSWIKENENCHLIQISTDHVYDGVGPHFEDDVKLINYYGFSKYAGELAALNVPSTILRTNFFGKSKNNERLSFSDWAYKSLINKEKIFVFDDVFFSPLCMQSLIQFINIIIMNPISGIFNLGSKEGLSKADFVYRFAKILGLETKNVTRISYKDMNINIPRPSDMRMDCSKFESIYSQKKISTLQDEIDLIKKDYEK